MKLNLWSKVKFSVNLLKELVNLFYPVSRYKKFSLVINRNEDMKKKQVPMYSTQQVAINHELYSDA